MATRYTDVDLMILKRWGEVKALREAFDDLIDRGQDIVETTLQKLSTQLSDKGFSSDFDAKQASIWFWKREWETRGKEPGIYFQLFDFAPQGYGRDIDDHPSMWFMTDEFSRLRMRESPEDFAKVLKAGLTGELLVKWDHNDTDASEQPLGRDCHEVSESQRVRFLAEPETLTKFIIERVDEFMELVPAIDLALQKMTRR